MKSTRTTSKRSYVLGLYLSFIRTTQMKVHFAEPPNKSERGRDRRGRAAAVEDNIERINIFPFSLSNN